MAGQFKPKGKAIYFRTVTTDAFQGPNMANFFAQTLKVKSVYVLDNSGAYGVGIANSFQKQAEKIGIKILGRDQLNPKEADYTTVLTKIKGLNPDALYYGGVAQAGVKLAKQAYDVIPNMIKGGGDGIQGGSFLKGGGFPAVEGWYSTNAGPHLTEDPAAAAFVKTFTDKYKDTPSDYSITAYDAALVVLDAIKRVAESGKEVNRANVRDAMQASNLKTLQGVVSFDENGDIKDRTVSVFQYKHDAKYPGRRPHASKSVYRGGAAVLSAHGFDAETGVLSVEFWDILLQQVINGVSLGAMYSLLALGFTMVYGIIELINFAHFNVFMVGSFIAMWVLQAMGFSGQSQVLYGLPLIGVLVLVFVVTMLGTGVLGALIERFALRPCAACRARRR